MHISTPRRLPTALLIATLAMALVAALALSSTVTTLVQLAVTTALVMGGTGMKALGDPHKWGPGSYLDQVNDTYLHLDPADLRWVQTPEHFWPATGLADLSFDTSVARGVLALDGAIRTTPGTKIIVGYSQSANIATREKRNLDDLRANGAVDVPLPDELSFVLAANPNRPNGGILARFDGLHIPMLGVSFDGATPNDDYSTIDVARQYDLIADFPKYPLNLLADMNALLGYVYLHPNYGSQVIDLADPSTYQSYTEGNTTYYLVHTENLPLLQPMRDFGFPEPVLDLVEPALRVLIELAYDRTLPNMAVPTRAHLLHDIDTDKLVSDLATALRQGVHNALDDVGIEVAGAAVPATSALDDREVSPPEPPAQKSIPQPTAVRKPEAVTEPESKAEIMEAKKTPPEESAPVAVSDDGDDTELGSDENSSAAETPDSEKPSRGPRHIGIKPSNKLRSTTGDSPRHSPRGEHPKPGAGDDTADTEKAKVHNAQREPHRRHRADRAHGRHGSESAVKSTAESGAR